MQQKNSSKQKKKLSLNVRNTLVGITFIIPNFAGFLFFILIPVCFSFLLSFTKWNGFTEMKFNGIKNFIKLFSSDTFVQSLSHTAVYAIFTVLFTLICSLGLAVLLNRGLRGTNFFRSCIFFPYVASIVSVGVVWNMLFQKDFGPINSFLQFLGVENLPGWFASTKWALSAVIVVSVWKGMGYYMVIYLAGLQGIPYSLYEAATVDGANGWQRFKNITIPMLTPTTFFVVMMLTINSFKVFDLIFVLTEGGPGTATSVLAKYIYDQSFIAKPANYGLASAASMILFLIVGTITIIQFRMEKKWVSYM